MTPPPGRDEERRSIERELKRGSLELIVLHLLTPGEAYGYEIVSKLTAETNGALEVTDGTLYPVLYRLERAGFVAVRWKRRSAASRGSTTRSPTRAARSSSDSPTSGRRLPRRWQSCFDAEIKRGRNRQMTITADDYVNRVVSRAAACDTAPCADRDGASRAYQRAARLGAAPAGGARSVGDPVVLAESYMSAEPLVAGDFLDPCRHGVIDFAPAGGGAVAVCGADLAGRLPEYVPWLLFVYLIGGGLLVASYPMVAEACTARRWANTCLACASSGVRRAHQRGPGHRAQPAVAAGGVLDRRAVCAVHRQEPARLRAAVEDTRGEVDADQG